ncbi:MAG: PA14 domain-containing protein [Verrucomicrobiota bacterium]|jgi:autotransporter-associated beta strand protein
MNSKSFTTATLGLVFCLLANHAAAQTLWWDNNGTGTPSSGTWDTTTANWSPTSALTASPVAFTSGDTALFTAGTAGISALTITVNGAVTCAGLGTGYQNPSCSYVTNITFNSGSSGSISIPSGSQSFYCDGVGNLIFNLPITGAGQLVQHGNGYIALNATNTYAGGTELTGGQIIYYYNNNSFGSGTITMNGTPGGALVNNSLPEIAITITNAFSFPTAGDTLNLAGGNPVSGAPGTTFSGSFSLPSGYTILETSSTATEVTEISGVISGTGAGLIIADAGTLELGGANTYTGGTTITNWGGYTPTLSIIGSGDLGDTGSGSGAYSGLITNYGVFTYASSTPQTLSGIISGTGTLTVNKSAANLTLTGANTYTGNTMITAGTLNVNSPGSLASGSAVTVASAGILNVSGTVAGTVTVNGGAVTNSGTISGALTLNAGAVTNSGTISGAITLTTGTLALNASSTAANLTVNGGTLSDLASSSITTLTFNAGSQTVNGSIGTLIVNGGALDVSATGYITGNVSVNGGTLELDNNTSALASTAILNLLTNTLAAGAVDLNFSGTQTIKALFFSGFPMAVGTYGSATSGATYQYAFFSGNGTLNVTANSGIYWDAAGLKASPGGGGTGSWDSTTSDWWVSGSSDTTWITNNIATFAGTAGTVTLANNETANGLVFTTPGYTIVTNSSSASAVLTLSGGPTITVPDGAATAIDCQLEGAGQTFVGPGTLILGGGMDNSGLTMAINSGLVIINKTSTSTVHGLGGGNSSVGIGAANNSAGLRLNGSGGYDLYHTTALTVNSPDGYFDLNGQSLTALGMGTLTLAGAGPGGAGALINDGISGSALECTQSGIVLAGNTTIGGSGNITLVSTVVSGPYSLTYAGDATLTLTNANTYSGGTIIDANGTVYLTNSASAAGTGTITVNANGALDVGIVGNNIILANAISGPGTVNLVETASNNLQLGGSMSSFTGTLNCPTSPGSTAKAQILTTGVNLNSAATVNVASGGTLYVANSGVIIPCPVNLYGAGNSETYGSLRIENGALISGPVTLHGNTTMGNGNSSSAATISGVIGDGGSGYGITFTAEPGTIVLSATNTYSGLTTVNGGVLKLGANYGVPTNSSLLIANAGAFNMNGYSDSIATLGVPAGTTAAGGNVNNDNATLTINGGKSGVVEEGGSGAYSGVISGTGNLAITGGEEVLSGVNTYSGTTTVSGGNAVPATLVLSPASYPSFVSVIPDTVSVGVTNPGVLDIVSLNQTLPSLSGNGTVNLEGGTLTVNGGAFSGVIENSPLPYANSPSVNGLQGFYYTNLAFTGLAVSRVDSSFYIPDFTQPTVNPLYPQTTDFSVRWIGQLLTTSASSYTFTTISDDGTRLWVNGQLVIDNWGFHGSTTRTSAAITLNPNTLYDFRLEYMQGGGGAICELEWTPSGGSLGQIPLANLFTYPGVGGLTMAGYGNTLTLSGTNTYAGPTTVSAGTLALASTGSISNSSAIAIAEGATFDVSAFPAYALSANATLNASGSGTIQGSSAAAINGASAGTVNLGAQPICLTYTPSSTSGDPSDPALEILQGALKLNNNQIVVTNAISALGAGTYSLIQVTDGVTGTINGAPAIPVIVAGNGLAAGASAAASVSGSTVIMKVVTPANQTTTALSSTGGSTYGSVALTAAVSPVPNGGVVQFFNNGAPLGSPVAVNTGTGLATLNLPTLSVAVYPSITAVYSGDSNYGASTAGPLSQTVTAAPLTVTANNITTTYGTFPAALTPIDGTTNYNSKAFTASGLQNGETIGTVLLVISGSAPVGTANEAVGSYTLTISSASGGTFNPANYSITYNTGTLTVNPLPATFSITSASLDSTGTNFVVCWQSVSNVVYYVLTNTSLAVPRASWPTNGTPITATNTTTCFTLPGGIVRKTNVFVVIEQ